MATNPIPAIDMWAPIVGTPEIIRQAVEHFPERMLGYLRVFFKHTPTRERDRAAACVRADRGAAPGSPRRGRHHPLSDHGFR